MKTSDAGTQLFLFPALGVSALSGVVKSTIFAIASALSLSTNAGPEKVRAAGENTPLIRWRMMFRLFWIRPEFNRQFSSATQQEASSLRYWRLRYRSGFLVLFSRRHGASQASIFAAF